MTPKHQEEFNNIIDCFTISDGGIKFLKVKLAFDEFDNRTNDDSAVEILDIMSKFSKLIDVISK